MKRIVVIFVAVAAFLAALLFGLAWQEHRRAARNVAPSDTASVGALAPNFTLPTLAGQPFTLRQWRGHAVVLNFWATWCPPCQQEIPWLIELQTRYAAQGLQIVGLAMDDDDLHQLRAFVKQNNINYPVLAAREEVAQQYGGVDFLPTTFYLDRQGRIVERVFGAASRDEIERNIRRALR